MTANQLPANLTLEAKSFADWDGSITLSPVLASEKSLVDRPGKTIADTLLVKHNEDTQRLLISLGLEEKLNNKAIRKAGIAASKWLIQHQVDEIGLPITNFETLGVPYALEAFCEGLLLGAFRFDIHKSIVDQITPITVTVLSDDDQEALLERVTALISGVNLTREWSHEPPNVINPITLAARAEKLAAESGLKCTIFGEQELTEMKAGAILSVGLGSKTPSQMIVLEHPGKGEQAKSDPVIIVGKAITFDTGGYSLKGMPGIVGMKYDKCGGMTVLGIMQAVAALDIPVPVVGIVAAAENMISSEAYRPNDIITSMSGKTIEIISTDAEGRMVLADALTYAHTHYQPRAIIDLATLTGGVVIALGAVRAGLMSNDESLAEALSASGERTNERLWRMPLDEEYFVLIEGHDSDMRNSSPLRQAHPIVGGIFLQQFMDERVPWAHIDIAGTATVKKSTNSPHLATGFGVRLLMDYLEQLT
ncbi:MAG: leucyl aminopeptidase family protein [Chloroflexi bacterium]|nr:leucyl aminopeptidase family protein [Chloroflexota bacterium]